MVASGRVQISKNLLDPKVGEVGKDTLTLTNSGRQMQNIVVIRKVRMLVLGI